MILIFILFPFAITYTKSKWGEFHGAANRNKMTNFFFALVQETKVEIRNHLNDEFCFWISA